MIEIICVLYRKMHKICRIHSDAHCCYRDLDRFRVYLYMQHATNRKSAFPRATELDEQVVRGSDMAIVHT